MADNKPTDEEFFDDELDQDGLSERLDDLDEELAIARAASLRAGLEDYDLDEEDFGLLELELDEEFHDGYRPSPPVLAIVGRPNVGKSALVNRILGRREAVVEDKPGITRDRVSYRAEWNGRSITLVDTGGWEHDASGIDASVAEQAEIAVELADAVLFVVDALVGPTASDERVVKMLRGSGKPVLLVANKIDDAHLEAEIHSLWNLGLGEPYPVSLRYQFLLHQQLRCITFRSIR